MRLRSSWSSTTFARCSASRRGIADYRRFAVNDLVLLRQTKDRSAPPILTKPLTPGRRIEGHRGVIQHEQIIGKRVREVVTSSTTKSLKEGTDFRLHELTLEDYVRLSKRLVTPIYGADANLITSLLDLHPQSHAGNDQPEENQPKLEILEAGTGHGSLTLYLSRAIHAANPRPPVDTDSSAFETWKERRQALIHTIDVSPKFSAHAERVVQGFRHGIYACNVDFHVGDVSQWVETALVARGSEAFFSHAFLDLPGADAHLAMVAKALRTDGNLVVFNPSITQITACASKIKDKGIPLDLENVLELGVNGGSGGREWDVRFVRPRSEQRDRENKKEAGDSSEDERADRTDLAEETQTIAAMDPEQGGQWSTVCRPRVGERVIGGGFLGVWRKKLFDNT